MNWNKKNNNMGIFEKMILKWRIKQAIRQARSESRWYNRKFMVLMLKGKPICMSKQRLKELHQAKAFRKGVTIEQIERTAIFSTQ